jgi:carbamoyltransferase
MIAWGVNALNHGNSLAVFKEGQLVSNRSSKQDTLDSNAIFEAFHLGSPDRIFWYEQPWIKKARQLRAGQYNRAFDLSVLPKRYLNKIRIHYAPITYTPHHASHAAAGYYTSPFNHCAVVVLDAIGEFECATIWEGKHGELKKVWSSKYPNSLGLYYSAFTQMLGMTPIQDEYLLQQMAEKGNPRRFRSSIDLYFGNNGPIDIDYNFHQGVHNWSCDTWSEQERCDLAAAVQERFEIEVAKVMYKAKELTGADCLVYMGGCAMNSAANKHEVEPKFKYIWSLPDPGDSSSSIGAVLYHTKQRVRNYNFGVAKHIAIRV